MMQRAAISEINKAARNFKSLNTMPTRTAMDVNDIKFDYTTLIIDENAINEKKQKEKDR